MNHRPIQVKGFHLFLNYVKRYKDSSPKSRAYDMMNNEGITFTVWFYAFKTFFELSKLHFETFKRNATMVYIHLAFEYLIFWKTK